MLQLKACTVCFGTDSKLFQIDKANLRNDFNWISGIQRDPANGMPEYLCSMCATYVRNCKRFRDKCQRAHYTLLELLRRNKQVKMGHLKEIDPKKLGIACNLSFNLSNQHYQEIKFQWVNYNRIGVSQRSTIPVATHSIEGDTFCEVPIKKPKLRNSLHRLDESDIKEELQFDSFEEPVGLRDTETSSLELLEHASDTVHDTADDFYDTCPANNNEQGLSVTSIEFEDNDLDRKADGADNQFEYATLIPMPFAEAKAALEVAKSFTKGDYRCDVCNRGYLNEMRLNIHSRMHDKYVSGFFQCELCVYFYKTDFLLQSHIKEKHMYKYMCKKCPEVSFTNSAAKQHYIQQHVMRGRKIPDDWLKHRPKWLSSKGGKREKKIRQSQLNTVHNVATKSAKRRKRKPLDFPVVSPVTQEDQYRIILERSNTKNFKESDYTCEYCFKGYREEMTYNNHMKKHNPAISGAFQCDMCKLYFKDTRKLYKHMTTTHIYKYSCQVCSFFCYNKTQASTHYKWHNNVTYSCPHCNKVFKKISTKLTHIRLKHPSSFICNLCGYSFVSEAGLGIHKRIAHSNEEPPVGDGPSCDDCGIQFASEAAFRTHLKSSTKHTATTVNKRVSARARSKRRHGDIHNNGVATANDCEVCGKFLENDVQARQHYETNHPGANYLKRYMCDVCGHATKQYANLMVHMRTHTREKPYSCPHCDRKFSMPSNRDRHLVVHTGEKRFQCQHCSRRFTQSSAVKLHIQTVHLKIPYAPWDKKSRKRRKELEGTGPISEAASLQPPHKLLLENQDYLNAYITYSDE